MSHRLLMSWNVDCLAAVGTWYWRASTLTVSPTGHPVFRGIGIRWVLVPSVTLLVSLSVTFIENYCTRRRWW